MRLANIGHQHISGTGIQLFAVRAEEEPPTLKHGNG